MIQIIKLILEFIVNDAAITILRNITTNIGVIAVYGKYRTGKSYLLNKVILNKELKTNSGFGVGPTINPHTKVL